MKYSKKANSYSHILKMKKGLTDKEFEICLKCHSTGYGEPGGFVSEDITPHLKNPGCEVCHGPGSRHIEDEDSESIKGELTIENCKKCHISERVEAFRFKPLIHGGAH